MKILKLMCISILVMIITGCSYKPSNDSVPDTSTSHAGSEEATSAAETAPDIGETRADINASSAGRKKEPSKAPASSTVTETTAAATEQEETTAEVFYLSEPQDETPDRKELPASEAYAEPIWGGARAGNLGADH